MIPTQLARGYPQNLGTTGDIADAPEFPKTYTNRPPPTSHGNTINPTHNVTNTHNPMNPITSAINNNRFNSTDIIR